MGEFFDLLGAERCKLTTHVSADRAAQIALWGALAAVLLGTATQPPTATAAPLQAEAAVAKGAAEAEKHQRPL